jgi:hypothetical protein
MRTVFVDAGAMSLLRSLLSSPYFDEAAQPHVLGKVLFQNASDDDDLSYRAAVMGIISNCLLPLSLFRDELIFSDNLVPVICRCSTDSSDSHLKTNSLCAISSALSSQKSQQLKIDILNMLDITRFLNTLETGSALEQQLCLLILRNFADGPAEDVSALLRALGLYDCPAARCISHFSDFCLSASDTSVCAEAGGARLNARALESQQGSPSKQGSSLPPNRSEMCHIHDCPVPAAEWAAPSDSHAFSCHANCARIRQVLASIVSVCARSAAASIEQLLLLLSNIAAGSSGRKALILDALQPSFLVEALTSSEDLVRRVSFFC